MRRSPVDDPLAAGRAAWPNLSVSPEIFATWVAERAPCAHVTDVYLACACALGDPAALAAFEGAFAAGVDAGLSRLGATPGERADVRAALAGTLFVGDAPAIRDYRGDGELGRWLRAVAVRTWLDLRRRHGEERLAGDERLDAAVSPGDEPEVAHFKRRHRSELAACFEEALARLGERDRALLRYHVVEGLTIDDLGALYRVHRSTAFRWLEAARDRLAKLANALLERRLGLAGAPLASALRLVRSQLDVNVRRLLG